MKSLQQIASDWHGGLWSAMYQYASSGVFLKENTLQYLWEAYACLIQYGAIKEKSLSISSKNELKAFIKGIEKIAKENGIIIEWADHTFYSYRFPVVANDVDFQMKPIQLLK